MAQTTIVPKDAVALAEEIVNKNYLPHLQDMEVLPLSAEIALDDVILYKVNKMSYDKDEMFVDKFMSAFGALTSMSCSVILILDGFADKTNFYIGIRSEESTRRTARSIADTFKSSLAGQFPGISIEDCSLIPKGESFSKQSDVFSRFKDVSSISSATVIPSFKRMNSTYSNANYIQGLEKLSIAMQGKRYTAIIIARNNTSDDIKDIRIGYENIYSQLSAQSSQQLALTNNESISNSINCTKGYTDTSSVSEMVGATHSLQFSKSETKGETHSNTKTTNYSRNNFWGKAGKAAGPLMEAGAILTATGVGTPVGVLMMGAGAIAGVGNVFGAGTNGESKGHTDGTNESKTFTIGTNEGFTESFTKSKSHADSFTSSNGQTATFGDSKSVTITSHNKHIEELLSRIDKQLKRISNAEGMGLWQAGSYFLSYNDRSTAEICSSIFRSIMQGEDSGIEVSAINTWYHNKKESSLTAKTSLILNYLKSLIHPIFIYNNSASQIKGIHVTASSLINSSELSMLMGLPRKSVPGLPVVEHSSLAKEVVKYISSSEETPLNLGCVFDQGTENISVKVNVDKKSLTKHVFITGSTGCGKSETVYKLIDEARAKGVKFLIVEPAKGEYKNVFGNTPVWGTNPNISRLLRINPFRFPTGNNGIHVLEHIDRLVEIFNVCWPMYAAMPAVLKKAVLACYEKCGWNLINSNNRNATELFPTFVDLQQELVQAINESAYSEEVKSNYTGSLLTRVESLTNGINGEIFASADLSDEVLFDENAIVDLSRVGSLETKSLIMGILIMRLSEYRMSTTKQANSGLRHITVLEEAHNILKRTSTEQSMESSNVAGKSVEMITNAIAEMRTYGECFVIVDQSPTSVAPAAIKNTNTKIIMRLPDGDDRKITGKASSMKDNQIDEIAKLPTGVAVVYQNDWVAPVLCKIDMYKGERVPFAPIDGMRRFDNSKAINAEILKLLLKGRVKVPIELDTDFILGNIQSCRFPTSLKIEITNIIADVKQGKCEIWQDENFAKLSNLIVELLSARIAVEQIVKKAKDFKELDLLLDSFVIQKASISENLKLAVRQCLMMQYGEKDDTNRRISDAWFKETKKQLLS